MAVSLVSTGVQFPDSSIQTTAAGSSAMVRIQSQTFSGASTVDFTTGINSSYKNYVFYFDQVFCSTTSNATFLMYFSNDGGSTYTGVSTFSTTYASLNINNGTWSYYANSSALSAARLLDQWSSSSNDGLVGTVLLANPSNTSIQKTIMGNFSARNPTGEYCPWVAAAKWASSTAVNAVRFTGAGTITGTIVLYGLT